MRRMMGEEDGTSFPKLKLQFMESTVLPESPEHPSTPPFQPSASVPFKWEEQPGKPRRPPCSSSSTTSTSTIATPPAKSLELPPHRFAKTPSPTTVLDGPYNVGRPRFSSFRFFNDSSFRSPEGTTFESLLGVSSNKSNFGKVKGGKRVVDGGAVSCRFSPSSCDSSEEAFVGVKSNCGVKMSRKGSFSTTAKPSQIWTSIYKGIKQVMHWKSSKKSNKQAPTACDGLN